MKQLWVKLKKELGVRIAIRYGQGQEKDGLQLQIFMILNVEKHLLHLIKIVSKLMGDLESPNPNIAAWKWGRKKETIARKQYVAMKKLKSKESVKVEERGIYIYLCASPDGIVCKSEPCLVEMNCPYKWQNNRVSDACKDPNIYCSIDENQNVQLKTNNRQFSQVQNLCVAHAVRVQMFYRMNITNKLLI